MPSISKEEVDKRHNWVRKMLVDFPTRQVMEMSRKEFGVSQHTAYKYVRDVRKQDAYIKELALEIASERLADLKVHIVREIADDIEKSKQAETRIWSLIATLKGKADKEDDYKKYATELKDLINTEIKNREARQKLYEGIDHMIGDKKTETQVNIQNNYKLDWGTE